MAIKFNLDKVFNNLQNISYDSLYQYFKTHHFQSLYVKQINNDLVLIHNNSNKYDNDDLHNECRSIIVSIKDSSTPKIVSYSHDNIEYSYMESYINFNTDLIQESYEGTMVNVYNFNDKWHFSSTKCPSIDDSYFFNKNKSHGDMFNEILKDIFPNSENVREEFTKYLDVNKYYFFVIVHYENKYLIDYSNRFGENYKKLIHVITRDKNTHIEESTKINIPIIYPKEYSSYTEAMTDELMNTDYTEGLIIKRKDTITNKNRLIKIPTKQYIKFRFEKPNYTNPLISCIEIFQRNNADYKSEDFIKKYYPSFDLKDGQKVLDITGILHYMFKNLSTELSIIYNYFTHYDKTENTFVKRNTTTYQNIIMKNDYKTLRNTINRLQNYQIKFLKRSFQYNDLLEHLRNYTSPNDIFNLLKEHNSLVTSKNELYKIVEVNMLNIEKYNKYVKLYIEKV